MHVCAVPAPATAPAAAASLRGTIEGVSSRSSHQWNCAAAGHFGTVAVTGVERLLLRGLCSTPNAARRSVEGASLPPPFLIPPLPAWLTEWNLSVVAAVASNCTCVSCRRPLLAFCGKSEREFYGVGAWLGGLLVDNGARNGTSLAMSRKSERIKRNFKLWFWC